MSRKRLTIFLGILLALIIIPTTLPYILGRIVLPWWALAFYAIIILINAGLYLVQRCLLIDRYFVNGRIPVYLLLTLASMLFGLGLQYLAHSIFGRFEISEGISASEYLGFQTSIAQLMLMAVLQIVTVFIALAVGMSDKWRLAAFRHNEAEKNNRSLKCDIESLKEQVNTLKRPETRKDTITVKVDLMKRQLRMDDILYVKSDGDYVVFHLSDGQEPMVLMTLKSLEKQLSFEDFCRIHRSYLVNVSKIEGIKGGKVIIAGEPLPLSDSCKAAFFELLSHKSITLSTTKAEAGT